MFRSIQAAAALTILCAATVPAGGHAATVTTIKSFKAKTGDGAFGVVADASGIIYGPLLSAGPSGMGAIFKYDPGKKKFSILHAFQGGTADGARPSTTLTLDNTGMLLGGTLSGGANNRGLIYRMNPSTGAVTDLHDYTTSDISSAGFLGPLDPSGLIYGSAGANIFTLNPTSKAYTVLFTFAGGQTDLAGAGYMRFIDNSGVLYGVGGGGPANVGGIFKFDTNSHTETILYFFGGGDYGWDPVAGLILGADGQLYGATYSGNLNEWGGVYKINPATGSYDPLANFNSSEVTYPNGPLLPGPGGVMYGPARTGGGTGFCGGVFTFTPSTSSLATFAALPAKKCGRKPTGPLGPIAQGSDGGIFGVTSDEQGASKGILYEITP
jgi:uncharacterized repeat protein (TIGR03803 family)